MAKHLFPKHVYVQHAGDNTTPYLHSCASPEGACEIDDSIAGAGQRVAVYELKRVVKLRKTVNVEEAAELGN